MARPVSLTIDDDPDVSRAIERDLRQRYNRTYRVMRAESGQTALDLLRRLEQRNDPVALLLVNYRMPRMNGIETLGEAIQLYPAAKRVLLTAYADTEAAIQAINDIQVHHYLLKPWDPPERQLYPVLDDLLQEWFAANKPPFEGVRVLGTRCRRNPTRHAIFSRAIRCRFNGWMLKRRSEFRRPGCDVLLPIRAAGRYASSRCIASRLHVAMPD